MMLPADQDNVVLFDEYYVQDLRLRLEELYRAAKSSAYLSDFLKNSVQAINASSLVLVELSPIIGSALPIKNFLETFIRTTEKQPPSAAISTLSQCVVHLGSLLLHLEASPSFLAGSASTVSFGIGIGVLPAATVAAITNIQDLVRIAPSIVLLSFRLALSISNRTRAIEDEAGTGSLFLPNIAIKECFAILEEFNANLLHYRRAGIDTITDLGFSIRGPPSTLDLFQRQFPCYTERTPSNERVTSQSCQAKTLLISDLEDLFRDDGSFDIPIQSRIHVLGLSSGKSLRGHQSLRQMLWQSLFELVTLPSDLIAVRSHIQGLAEGRSLPVIAFGCSDFTKTLQASVPSIDFIENPWINQSSPEDRGTDDAIAIVGMSGRFPGAESVDELWQVLSKGIDMHKEIPPDRFDVRTHCDASGTKLNTSVTPYGCFISKPDLFDTSLFHMSAREAAQTDPMQRLMLMTAYEALEMAGYSAEDPINALFGTYYGQSSDDWREVNAGQQIDIFHITGGNRAFGPGRVSYYFGWEGPSMSVDTACSASAVSIQLACSALKSRECDVTLAGGANILTASDIFAGLSRGGFLSPTGSCKTWDAQADGYCRADAVGTIVLKRLDDAIRNSDNVLAVVRSVVTNHSAKAVSITHPHSETQAKLVHDVLRQAQTSPESVDYVETHGTGTQAGDVAESQSVASVFAKPRNHPLYIGTVKSNVGHGEAASGVTSIIKAVLMLRNGTIPRHVGIKRQRNPRLAFNSSEDIIIPLQNTPFPPKPSGDKRKILVNNFNATSGNTSLLLEEAPVMTKKSEDPRRRQIVVFSAATSQSLIALVAKMSDFIATSPELKVSDLSYTTTARRMHHKYRLAYVVEGIDQLESMFATKQEPKCSPVSTPPIVFLFSGQSGPIRSAASSLLRTSATFRRRLKSIDNVCQTFKLPSVFDVLETCDETRTAAENSARSQTALVTLEIALVEQWKSWGLQPAVVIGHSLGEYAALYSADVLSLADVLYLLSIRLELLEQRLNAESHGMAVLNVSAERTREILHGYGHHECVVAAINSPRRTVVSGPKSDLQSLDENLRVYEPSVRVTMLKVPYAFHSAQMDRIRGDYEKAAQGVHFRKPAVPVVSTLLGTVVTTEGTFSPAYMSRQTREPVRFMDALQTCRQYLEGVPAVWLEVGPSPVCIPMVRSTLEISSDRLMTSLDPSEDSWETISGTLAKAYLAGINIKWKSYHSEYETALKLLELPSYCFDLKSYWLQYEGDWSVVKNQKQSTGGESSRVELLSTTVHQYEGCKPTASGNEFTFTFDFAEPSLKQIAMGHLVNGSALCPSSVYADMIMTAASYCWKYLRPDEQCPSIDVANMEVLKPLIVGSQVGRIVVEDFGEEYQFRSSIRSTTDHDDVCEHVRCSVRFEKTDNWTAVLQNNAYLYQSRVDLLLEAASRGKAHRMLKGMVYKLFSSLVDYDEDFQMIEEVILNSELKEGTALVQLRQTRGVFHCDPHWIDALAHLSGFILNGSDCTPRDLVYISHGWESMRFAKDLVADHTYRTYVRMQPAGSRGCFAGDLYIFDGDAVAGVINGLRFQEVKRSVLTSLLPREGQKAEPVPATLQQIHDAHDSSHSNRADALPSITPRPLTPATSDQSADAIETFRNVITQETGLAMSEMGNHTIFVDIGIDSLLGLAVISAFQSQASIQLPLDFFQGHPRLADAIEYLEALGISNQPASTPCASQLQQQCTFLHIKRSAALYAPTLFLFPDGSGSGSSYVRLSNTSFESAVIAFNSPYQTDPDSFTKSLEEIATLYVQTILNLKPQGSIILGGWSIGAVYAYEVSRQMLALGIKPAGLLIIDAVNPDSMPPLPLHTVDILKVAGTWDSADVSEGGPTSQRRHPEEMQLHFKASIRALEAYKPSPLPQLMPGGGKQGIACRAIWARHGALQHVGPERLQMVKRLYGEELEHANAMQEWLLFSKRDDFGSHGWNELVGGPVESTVIDGHHFSIIRPPAVEYLCKEIDEALVAILKGG